MELLSQTALLHLTITARLARVREITGWSTGEHPGRKRVWCRELKDFQDWVKDSHPKVMEGCVFCFLVDIFGYYLYYWDFRIP
jgi:hypothetical protein